MRKVMEEYLRDTPLQSAEFERYTSRYIHTSLSIIIDKWKAIAEESLDTCDKYEALIVKMQRDHWMLIGLLFVTVIFLMCFVWYLLLK